MLFTVLQHPTELASDLNLEHIRVRDLSIRLEDLLK